MTRSVLKFLILLSVFFAIAGTSAYLTLSLVIESEETVVVPNLSGRQAVQVLELLSGLGLNTRVEENRYSPEVPKDMVISQQPEPGTVIKKGREVRVILSKGPKTLSAPKLVGIALQRAETILANNGLEHGSTARTFHAKVPKDSILAQNPPGGATVEKGEKIDLLISLGPRPNSRKMPDITGIPLEKAMEVLESRGLSLGRLQTVHLDARMPDLVVEQNPLSGYYIESEQAVDLTVNRWSSDKKEHAGAADRELLFRYQLPPGVLKQHVRLELHAFGVTSTLYDRLMEPEKRVWVMVPRYTDATIFLYRNDQLIQTEVYR
ncbi:MAG TPA: PASTA domain-containing protein [Desulfosalsimonadaceae bacterium]|nr:PASTA domain-containing protein [Desulfosalsimonadaceae bacterium]